MHNLPYNGRMPLLGSRAMTQPIRFAALFAVALVCAGAAFADPYKVRDLTVDKVAPSGAEAIQQGREDAKMIGAQRLIDRLTLAEDRAQHEALDPATVARFASGVTTQVESKTFAVSGGVRATGVVTWSFTAKDMRAYLASKGVPFVDTQAAKVMIIPVAAQGVDPNAWGAQWHDVAVANGQQQVTGKSDDTVLTPYVASIESWPRRPGWSEVQAELSAQGADHGVIAEAYSQGGQVYVRLIDLRTGADSSIGVVGPFPDLASAKAGAIAELERAWKAASIVRTSGSTNVSLIASFKDIGEWVRIKRGLENSRLISGLNVESLSVSGADISFAFAGRPDQLAADLRSRGVDLHSADNMWVVQVVAAQ
ncbi:MAG TPA: hypothetical protein VG942_09725 [Hyphomonadaceae bacterium]|nr:hypothetical protein [Hyphomonadaceae bacterium]